MKNLNRDTVIEELELRLNCSKEAYLSDSDFGLCNGDCTSCKYCPQESYSDVLRSALYFLKKEEK